MLDRDPGQPERRSGAGRRHQLEPEADERACDRKHSNLVCVAHGDECPPPLGSARPAARSAFANAVAKSDALAITSPVERISGPSTGSAPGKRANGSTAALTW